MTDMKSILIGGLVVLSAVLAYMVYDDRQRSINIELPSVKINKG